MQHKGFTLIEVLLAMVIIAIALTAIVVAVGRDIRATNRLEQKTAAHTLALTIIHKAQLGLIKPNPSIKDRSQILRHHFIWQALLKPTPNANIHKITVKIFNANQTTPVDVLHGYTLDSVQP